MFKHGEKQIKVKATTTVLAEAAKAELIFNFSSVA
jgi:hypothetical protein